MRDQVRDVGRANEGESEAVGGVAGLGEGLAAQCVRLGVEGGVATVPEESAVGLIWVEIAEVAAATKAASAAPATSKTASSTAATATPSAGTTWTSATWTSTTWAASSGSAIACVGRARGRRSVAEVDPGERIG